MPTGLTKDAGRQIGVSRTIACDLVTAWDYLTGPGLPVWLGITELGEVGDAYETPEGIVGEIRSVRALDRVRLTYGTSTVQVTVSATGAGKTTVRFHQERLGGVEEREARRAHWTRVMDEVEAALRDG